MKLDESPRSDNVEDERGSGIGRGAGIGIGTIVIVVIGYFLGISPVDSVEPAERRLAVGYGAAPRLPRRSIPTTARSISCARFWAIPKRSGARTSKTWARSIRGPSWCCSADKSDSACGLASSAAGPFYCPGDQKVYIDLSFYRQLATEFGAPGDFARAYVIAHEVGHHVQNLLGITDSAAQSERRAGRIGANQVSVRVELQADCFAGVWAQQANRARKILEPGDLDQGLAAASSVGDDTLQKRTQGTVVPDSFTHGTSAQRVRWFRRGFDSGKIDNCDTFSAGESL